MKSNDPEDAIDDEFRARLQRAVDDDGPFSEYAETILEGAN